MRQMCDKCNAYAESRFSPDIAARHVAAPLGARSADTFTARDGGMGLPSASPQSLARRLGASSRPSLDAADHYLKLWLTCLLGPGMTREQN